MNVECCIKDSLTFQTSITNGSSNKITQLLQYGKWLTNDDMNII